MMVYPDMQTLGIFCDVAQQRSFSLGAAQQGLTQSAVSQRVSLLEKRLGVALIDRSVRPLALTDAGQRFLDGCCQILAQYKALEGQVASHGATLHGLVRVDAIYSAGIDLLNWIKALFEAEHPGVSVRVKYKRPEEVHEQVLAARCDLGIVSFPDRWHDVAWTLLRNERMILVCGLSHPLAGRRGIQVNQLHGLPLIAFESGLPVAHHVRSYLRQHDVKPVISNMFDNIDTIKTAVALTSQAAVLPQRTVQREVASGMLAMVELAPPLMRPVGLIHPRRNGSGPTLAAAAEGFVDCLLKHAGPGVDSETFEATRRRFTRQPA